MNDIYLDRFNKEYYSTDFTQNVLTETDNFWKLDDSIREYIVELNNCKQIQPLYSKFPDFANPNSEKKSYLWFAYSKEIELTLFRNVLSNFICKYNQLTDSKCFYSFHEANTTRTFEEGGNPSIKMGCFNNPEYFKINYIILTFECWDKHKHLEFWNELRSQLKNFDNENGPAK
ncbi:MAG: hypothetical protein P9M03_06325 [Candidatus Theseobacter exili]|nr:hypothetical protein [Candidatus Theseobacter exili]